MRKGAGHTHRLSQLPTLNRMGSILFGPYFPARQSFRVIPTLTAQRFFFWVLNAIMHVGERNTALGLIDIALKKKEREKKGRRGKNGWGGRKKRAEREEAFLQTTGVNQGRSASPAELSQQRQKEVSCRSKGPSSGDQKNELIWRCPQGIQSKVPRKLVLRLQRRRTLKSKSTVEKEQLSHRKVQKTRTDTPVGHGALIMRPDGEWEARCSRYTCKTTQFPHSRQPGVFRPHPVF